MCLGIHKIHSSVYSLNFRVWYDVVERTAAEDQIGAIFRSKRSRCAYLPTGSTNCLERTNFHVPPLQRLNGESYETSANTEKSTSKSSESYSSKSDTGNGERTDTIKQLSGR